MIALKLDFNHPEVQLCSNWVWQADLGLLACLIQWPMLRLASGPLGE